MNKHETNYCRFCAEPKQSDKLLNLVKEDRKYEETVEKLAFLNAAYVNVTDPDCLLPKTVCFVCYEALNKCYQFLLKVQHAQDVLNSLFNKADSDDDGVAFEDLLDRDCDDSLAYKHESPVNSESKEIQLDIGPVTVEVKREPKEEVGDSTVDSSSHEDFDQTLNVQDLLDAAMGNVPFPSDVTIYAKEVTAIDRKVVPTWKEYPWVCVFCNTEFLDMSTLRSHSKLVHGKCSAFMCVDCKRYAKNDFGSFLHHVKRHRKILKNHCHYCDMYMEDVSDLTTHIKTHFQKTQTACPSCGEILSNEDCLQAHLAEYDVAPKPKRKPRRKPGTPITIEDLTCKLCQKVYKNPNSLRDHMKLHTNDRKRNYTCDRCGKNFFSKGSLTCHIMSHDQNRPHVCRICNKSFLFPNMLRRHVEMHSGVKPYSCEQCGRCFRLQYQLNTHKIIHTDKMPHVCQYCNKAFRFKQIMKNHERQHTGAKPYSCQHCIMEFTNWSNYNKHMKRRHGTDKSKKKITPDGVFPINPETGQLIQLQDADTEEWKTRVMVPGKRGKKKVVKEEDVGS